MEDDEGPVRYIGPLKEKDRLEKVLRYLQKKYNKANSRKHCYTCRQQVAGKRLRIKGRFVTREQAYEILGLTQGELLDNVKIQDMLTKHAENPLRVDSLIENNKGDGQMIKVSNFQALIDSNYRYHSTKAGDGPDENHQGAVSQKSQERVILTAEELDGRKAEAAAARAQI